MKMIEKKINICFECLDKKEKDDLEKVAIRYLAPVWDQSHPSMDITYGELKKQVQLLAGALLELGVKKGDVVFSLSPRIPELYVLALSVWRIGAIFSPLFSAFGPGPILSRMEQAEAKVIFSLASLFEKKIEPIMDKITSIEHVILIDDNNQFLDYKRVLNFYDLLKSSKPFLDVEPTSAEDIALLHFTSGTTGKPKGAMHVHEAVNYHRSSGAYALDIQSSDIFWCTADPGWVTGTSYGIIAPLCLGATLIVDGAEFSPQRWYDILKKEKVNIWYTSPTALRMLMKAGEELAAEYEFPHLRFAASVGEPLNPEVIRWVQENLKITLHDNWWQTETGGIIICNSATDDIRVGSMGKPLPDVEVSLIKNKNKKLRFAEVEEEGEIVIKTGWPSMFRGYLNNPVRYEKSFYRGWYLSGDLAKKDKDGYFWFVGRKDDVIKTSGHLIGPFEIENILMEYPSVLEAAAIGLPDPVAGEIIMGFVVLKKELKETDEQRSQILAYARKKLGPAIAPRKIKFMQDLPKTRSGKIMRRLLKARELNLPEGDLSTLEVDSGRQ